MKQASTKGPVFAGLLVLLATPGFTQQTFNSGIRVLDTNLSDADLFVTDTSVLDGQVCIGNSCSVSHPFASDALIEIVDTRNQITFTDTSSSSNPDRDWQLLVNDTNTIASGGLERFSISDITAGTIPFTVLGGAPANAFWMNSSGQIGLGTSIPTEDLHLVDNDTVSIRLAPSDPGVRAFDIRVNQLGYGVRQSTGAVPFQIAQTAPSGLMVLENDVIALNTANFDVDFSVASEAQDATLFVDASAARVGIGTDTPEELLHIRTSVNNADAFALFDAAGTGADAAFRLRQQGTVPTTWEFRNQETSGRLNVGIAGGNTPFKIDDAANNNLMRLGLNSGSDIVSITGRLLVNNTQLNVPDYVFSDDYDLRPLEEVQAFVDTHRHLPDVPSAATILHAGVDMSQMQMTLLKKVEELTLYTLELENARRAQDTEMAQIRQVLHDLVQQQ